MVGTLFYNLKKIYLFSPESFRLVCSSGCIWSANSKAHLCSDCGALSDIPCVPRAWGFHFIHHFQWIPSIQSTEEISFIHMCTFSSVCARIHVDVSTWIKSQSAERYPIALDKFMWQIVFTMCLSVPHLHYPACFFSVFLCLDLFWCSEPLRVASKRLSLKQQPTNKWAEWHFFSSFLSGSCLVPPHHLQKNTTNSSPRTKCILRMTHLMSSILQLSWARKGRWAVCWKWKISNGAQSSF